MGEGDLETVLEVARESMPTPWSLGQFSVELQYDQGVRLVAEQEKLCGFIVFRLIVPEAELLQLAVLPCLRRRGVASSLVLNGLRQLHLQQVEECFLEVRKGNRKGRCFYQQAGFQQVGLRKKYYADPVDDAVLMKKIVQEDGVYANNS